MFAKNASFVIILQATILNKNKPKPQQKLTCSYSHYLFVFAFILFSIFLSSSPYLAFI